MASSGYQVEVTISSAQDLKNVNWRYGPNRPYAVVWVDPNEKRSCKVDEDGDTCPHWGDILTIPLPGPVDSETTLFVDIVHAGKEEDTKKLIGSARLKLKEVLDEAGHARTLTLKRPSGRPQGKVDVKNIRIIEPRYPPRDAYNAPPYGSPAPPSYGGYPYPQPPPPTTPYYHTAPPPSGYPYAGYNAPPQPPPTTYGGYNAPSQPPPTTHVGYHAPSQPPPTTYGQTSGGQYGQQTEKKKHNFGGIGAGLAMGAVAGALGGLVLAEGIDKLEDHIAERAADKVEKDYIYGDL